MEKHKCKLCYRSFSNGRALGGHMRSHMLSLPIPPKLEKEEESPPPTAPLPPPPVPARSDQLSYETESASSSSSSEEEEDEKGVCYELRENPKRSIRLVDPEFSFPIDAGSVVLQDRESETESSKNPTRRRSKRTRKSGVLFDYKYHQQKLQAQEAFQRMKFGKLARIESWAEPEPVSSVSDATTEEDVAFCLMMLSRDKWKKQEEDKEEDEEEGERSFEESDESEELKSSKTARIRGGKYKCETCKKVFRSYQALGGHRASHKKIKLSTTTSSVFELEQENAGTSTSPPMAEKKIHECPVCFRVFSSGQALGGHKRSHVTGSAPPPPLKRLNKLGDSLIDLNLPAPIDEDEISQIELSAVSDAEFVNPIRQ
ncbi:hypothetical protein UlMin_021467 [Ulmus minor]